MEKRAFVIICLVMAILMAVACGKKTTEPDQVAVPVMNPPGGTYTEPQNVTINCATDAALIYYTTDGTDPTPNSASYSAPLAVAATTTLKARAYKNGWNPSPVASAMYQIEPTQTVATPVFDPPEGTYTEAQVVAISCATSGSLIFYTTDGTDPTPNSASYTAPLAISATTTLKARAYKDGWNPSLVASATYAIEQAPEDMIYVAGGTFNPSDSYTVSLSPFYIGRFEVTQAEYQSVTGSNPSYFTGDPNRPVESVSWFQAIRYCNLRSIQEGLSACYTYEGHGTNPSDWPDNWDQYYIYHTRISFLSSANGYRLPTEMEWMYAAIGGNLSQNFIYSGSDNALDVAWYLGNADWSTHPVGLLDPNELGTHDMSGNVYEWCWDIHDSNDPDYPSYPPGIAFDPQGPQTGDWRMTRGGNYDTHAWSSETAHRAYATPLCYAWGQGLRICRNAE